MKKTFKIIAALLGLLLVVVLIIPLLFNPDDYKGEVEQLVKEATGRELAINDEIELSLFPWIGIRVGEVELGSAPHLANEQFARIESAEIKLRLLPLLTQRLEVGTVKLHGLRLDLTVAPDGTTNWDDLTTAPQPAPTTQGDSETSADSTAASSGVTLAALAIGGLHVDDAEVSYTDHGSDLHYAVRQLSLKTGPLSLGAPLEVAFSSQFEASQPAISGTLELQTSIQVDLHNERYRFNATTLAATLNGATLPGGTTTLDLVAEIDLDMRQQSAALSSFELESYGLTLSGALDVNQLQGEPTFNGNLHLAEFNPGTVMPALDIELPETADATALSRMQLAFAVDGSLDQYRLHQLMVKVDESHIDGDVQLVMGDASLPAVKYALTIDQIDADRYLPPPVADEENAPAAAPATGQVTPASPAMAGAAATTLPLETLRELDLNGTLNIGKLKFSGLHLSEIRTEMDASAGVIRLHPLSAELYQGQYRGDLRLDVRGDHPKIALNESLKQIHVGPLLKDYMGEEKVRGVGNVQAKLTASGETPDMIISTLNGEVKLEFVDGAIKDVNIVQMVREAQARLKGEPVPPASTELQDTDFAEMMATLNITNGVVKNRDLSIKSPYLRVAGEGQASLVNESIDYLAKVVISKTEQGQGGAELDSLRGLTLPVRIGGTFDKPQFKLELGDLLKAEADKALAREKAKLKAKLEQQKAEEKAALEQKLAAEKERLKREAKDKLKELFNR